MARVVVIDELSRWGLELAKDLVATGYQAESFGSINAYLHTLKAQNEGGVRAPADVMVLALHGRGAAAVWYDLAVERISKSFSQLSFAAPGFVFAADCIPDEGLVRIAVDCQAAVIEKKDPELIHPAVHETTKKQEPPLPCFYGDHSCKDHPPCLPGRDVLEVGIDSPAGPKAVPLGYAPCVYFDYIAQNVSIQRPQSASQIVKGMLESPFHSEALDGRINIRAFRMNFLRISRVVNTKEHCGQEEDAEAQDVAITVKYGMKEVRYALRCKYCLRKKEGR